MNGITTVIAAISTPPGKGGVAVIRMSGEGSLDILRRVFVTPKGSFPEKVAPRVQIYGYIKDKDETLDDVLVTYFKAPASFTGEDVVEISTHGGILVSRAVLGVLLKNGARAAEAGEFTKRAFLSGKLTLTEAEAIANLLDAKTRAEMRLCSEPSRKRLSERIEQIRVGLVGIMSSLYARIDYPDEDLGELSDEDILGMLRTAEADIRALLATYRTGLAVTEGIKCAIVGKPNVGKSSLFNMLVGEDSAIVTDIAGTTRDVISESVPLGKVLLRLSDTAGIRSEGDLDAVERIGIQKSIDAIDKCQLIFTLFDISAPLDLLDREIISLTDKVNVPKIAILNKADLPHKIDTEELSAHYDAIIPISAGSPDPSELSALTDTVESLFIDGELSIGEDAVISSERQRAVLEATLDSVVVAREALESGIMQDAVSSDVERAIGALSELDGRAVGEQVVADIFSRFCVGK